MLHIKCRSNKILGDLYTPQGVYIEFYIHEIINKPEYPIDVEAEQDQEKDVHRLFERWEKRYTVSMKGIESICDIVSLLPMMDEIYINGNRAYDVATETTWDEEYDCLANIVITFITKKIIKTL
jgi:hypothetical protein